MGEKCIHIKEDGKRCGSWAVHGEDYCRRHMETPEGLNTKPATKPWNSEGNPWSLNLLRLKQTRPGFRCKWANPDTLPAKLDQGWKIADINNYGGKTDKLPGEEGESGTIIKRREMILIEISEEMAKQRADFFDHRANAAMKAAQEVAQTGAGGDLKAAGHDPRITSKLDSQRGGF